jgi:hypothetical protein
MFVLLSKDGSYVGDGAVLFTDRSEAKIFGTREEAFTWAEYIASNIDAGLALEIVSIND